MTGRDSERGVLRSRNVVASVTEVARVYRIRLDDEEHPEMWLEITVEVETARAEAEGSRCEQPAMT